MKILLYLRLVEGVLSEVFYDNVRTKSKEITK